MKSKLLLLSIILLAFLLRFYNLGQNPPSLNSDEVAIGYNAYSILKTGHDEYDQFMPSSFRSYDDYKPPLYVYATVPSVAIFGLNPFSVRLPAAMIGLLAIYSVFLISKELTKSNKIALLAAFLLGISPWHLLFTRTAYETATLILFLCAGSYFFMRGKTHAIFYLPSVLLFAISPFFYQSGKIIAPAIVGCLIVLMLWPSKVVLVKKIIITMVFVVLLIPGFYSLVSPEGSLRFRGLSIFNDSQISSQTVEEKRTDWFRNDNRSAVVFHPEFSGFIDKAIQNYLAHFSPNFLVFGKDDSRISYVPHVGLIYLIEIPFLMIGAFFLWSRRSKRTALLISAWFLIAPLPASVTMGAPSSVRIASIMFPLYLIVALGVVSIQSFFKVAPVWIKTITVATVVLLYSASLSYFNHEMFVHAPLENSKTWYYSYTQMVKYVSSISPKYKQIFVSNSLDEPYMFFLFYTQKDPHQYQKNGGTVSGGFAENRNRFDKYLFTSFDTNLVRKNSDYLAVGLPGEFSTDAPVIKKFYYLNGQPSIYVVSSKKP